ncbi:MAG: hypothetical protein R2865_12045 [Deinococcales bacterium]
MKQEPNNRLQDAQNLTDKLEIRGSFASRDWDSFAFVAEGDSAQLYRIQVLSDSLYDITLYDANGQRLQQVNASGQSRIRLDNLVLLPSRYYLELDGDNSTGRGDYALKILSLGPADASAIPLASAENAPPSNNETQTSAAGASEDIEYLWPRPEGILEIEENNNSSLAERLDLLNPRIGTLNDISDLDFYRFSLRNDSYIRLEVIPAQGGQIQLILDPVGIRMQGFAPDQASYIESWLLAGDYSLGLRAIAPSDGYYQLKLKELNPLTLPSDLEPNNHLAEARPLPLDPLIEGYLGEYTDEDWYLLPLLTEVKTITIAKDSGLSELSFFDVETEESFGDRLYLYQDKDWEVTLPADKALAMRLRGNGPYKLSLDLGQAPETDQQADFELVIESENPILSAYWPERQILPLKLQLKNLSKETQRLKLSAHSSIAGVDFSALADFVELKGEEIGEWRLELHLPSNLPSGPLTLSFAASNETISKSAQLSLNCLCQNPVLLTESAWPLPENALGQWNVALATWGTTLIEQDDSHSRDNDLIDGHISPANSAARDAGEIIYLDLPGDEALTLTGTSLNPLSRYDFPSQLSDFEVLSSLDGENYQSILITKLSSSKTEQYFAFPETVKARYAALRFISKQDLNDKRNINLGEWKLFSPDAPLVHANLADPRLGGHVLYSSPLMPQGNPILTEVLDQRGERVTLRLKEAQTNLFWVMGFHHERAALIEGFEWLEHSNSQADQRLKHINISYSLDSPLGPWLALNTWQLNPDNTEHQLKLETPIWARYLRFESNSLTPKSYYDYPETLRVFEAGEGSILSEWGQDSDKALYEWLHPTPPQALIETQRDDNDSKAKATSLDLGQAVQGEVQVAEDEDWFKITVPEGHNLLKLSLKGLPSFDYSFALEDSKGQPIGYDLKRHDEDLSLEALVTAGDYYLHLFEPPRSVAFTWDSSGSVGPYLDITYGALKGFAKDIQRGREEVSLAVFAGDRARFLLPRFSGDPLEVLMGIRDYDRLDGSSEAESALLSVTQALKDREGSKSILLITDAESGSYPFTEDLWQAFAEVKPRIFSFEVSSAGNDIPKT